MSYINILILIKLLIMEEQNLFDIEEFISIILQSFSYIDSYAKIVKEEKIENKIFIKEQNEKYTELDYLTQTFLVRVFKKFYSNLNLKIIGEETLTEEYDKIIIDMDNIYKKEFLSSIDKISKDKKLNFPAQFNLDSNKLKNIANSEISFFLDPIDGTKSLIKKKFYPVTSLFGVCINNQPFIGFIHFIFDRENKTYFNFPTLGIYEYTPIENKFEKKEIKYDDDKFKFVISSTRATKEMIDFIKTFPNSEYENESGLGTKMIKCLLEDKIYFTTGKNSVGLWDICSASCLLNELGTDIYYFNGNKVQFVPKKIDFEHNGVICISKKKLNTFLEHVKKYYSQNI